MQKHPEITRRRINAFLQHQLRPLRYGEEVMLEVEVNENPCKNQAEAMKGPWKKVEKGFRYGPAYRVLWFRISGKLPASLIGKETVIVANVGGERTVWRDNSPYCGIDVEHSDFGWLEGERLNDASIHKLEVLEYVQVYTQNPQTTVWGKEAPRAELVEEVKDVKLVEINRQAIDLTYDFEFTASLLDTIDSTDPGYQTLLRAANDAMNHFDPLRPETYARCRKLIRDAMGDLASEYHHAVYPIGHAHLDTAWLWPLEITHLKMAHTAANQLRLMERYPEYVFAHSQASQYEWIENEYPKLFKEIKAAIDRGQWEVVGSMWVEADCNLTGSESMVRQFLYGRRYFRDKLGVQTQDMWLPDVFGYSAALPQILKKFDIKYFLTQKISWNQFNKFPHHTFWWKGIDGSKIWSHFPPADTYCGNCEPKEVVFSVKNYKDHARADQSLYAFGYGDGGGGPTERHLEFLRRGKLAPHYPEVKFGSKALEFYREAHAASSDLSTWSGELYLELHRGTYTSQAANKRDNRHCEFLLRDAEWLSCFVEGFPMNYPSKELEKAWKLVLLNQFHDIIPGSSVREVYEDSDRDYKIAYEIGERVIQNSLQAIGKRLDSEGFNRPVALFHNGSEPTQGVIPWNEELAPTALVAGDEILPVQLVEEWGERKLIFSTPTNCLGTVSVADLVTKSAPVRPRLKSSSRRIENESLSVRFDANGNISSIQSLEDGSEFVEPGQLANMFQLFDDHPLFWSAWDVDIFAYETGTDLIRSEKFEIVERGPVRVAAEIVKKFGNSTIHQRISLGPTPGIRFDTFVDWHEEDQWLKVAFPVNINSSRANFEIQFGNVERSTHSNTSWDVAKFEVCAHKWIDLSESDHGISLINESKYGFDVRGNVMRISLLRAPKAPDPICDMGEHRFSYVLMPHFGPYNQAGVVRAAYGFNAPLRHSFLEPKPGVKITTPQLMSCDDRNIVIETVKKAEDGNGVIVRLYECHNARGKATLSCAIPIKNAVLCNLEEKPLVDLEMDDSDVTFLYKPFEIITIRLDII